MAGTTTPTCYDVLILGAGPAGIAAARYLQKMNDDDDNDDRIAFRVLEARSRVGGRAHTSDSLGVNFPLDKGARWVHGTCLENRMVQLVRDREFDHPSDVHRPDGVEYEVCLPWDEKTIKTPKKKNNACAIESDQTPPPFELLDSVIDADSEPMIVKLQNDKRKRVPTKNMTKILVKESSSDERVLAKTMSLEARKVAKRVFRETVQSAMEDPHQKLNSGDGGISVSEQVLEEASLMDVLLWSHEITKNNASLPKDQRHSLFESLCRTTLVAKNRHVQEAVALIDPEEKRESFRNEVFALFNLEIYTFFESWEGAPVHSVSAKYGMASTCLSGGNTVLTFGYGGLVERLAYPLIQNNSILLEQNVISIETTENKVVVRCQVSGDDSGKVCEIQAKACIIALPLGVLRAATSKKTNTNDESAKSIAFIPELSAPLLKSIQSLGIAVRNKIELLFPSCWWPESVGRITLACTHLQQTPTYHPYTTFIVESASSETDEKAFNILVCYVAGEFAKELEQKTDQEIQEECMAVLRQADLTLDHQTTIPDPTAIHVTRWLSDPYSRGSWSFYGKGSNPDNVRAFRTNLDCQNRGLFFAGEHTCYGSIPGDDMGCVHGAWVSGEIAAKASLERIKGNP